MVLPFLLGKAVGVASVSSIGTRLEFNPISIWLFDNTTHRVNRSEVVERLQRMRDDDYDGDAQQKSMRGGWRKELNLSSSAFHSFENSVKSLYHKTLVDLGWTNPNRSVHIQAWANIHNMSGSYNVPHNHPNCHISGVFYARVPKGSGRIRFFAPHRIPNQLRHLEPEMQHWVPVQGNRLASDRLDIQPLEGLFLMFPSYLIHDVLKSFTGEAERVSIAFNIFPSLDVEPKVKVRISVKLDGEVVALEVAEGDDGRKAAAIWCSSRNLSNSKEDQGSLPCTDAIAQEIKAARNEILKRARYAIEEKSQDKLQKGEVRFSSQSMVDMRVIDVNV